MYEIYKDIDKVGLRLIATTCIFVAMARRRRGERLESIELMQMAILALVLQVNL